MRTALPAGDRRRCRSRRPGSGAGAPRAATTKVPIRIWPTIGGRPGPPEVAQAPPDRYRRRRARASTPGPVTRSSLRSRGEHPRTAPTLSSCDRGGVGPGRSMCPAHRTSSSRATTEEHPSAVSTQPPERPPPARTTAGSRDARTGAQAVVALGHRHRHRRDRRRALHDRGRQQRHVEGLDQLQQVHQRRWTRATSPRSTTTRTAARSAVSFTSPSRAARSSRRRAQQQPDRQRPRRHPPQGRRDQLRPRGLNPGCRSSSTCCPSRRSSGSSSG